MKEHEKWQWQEWGTAWKGAGLYHITLTIPGRQPLLGTLLILGNDPAQAEVRRTALGDALVECLLSIPAYHPEVKILHFCLMPDHLHAVLYVQRTMPTSIRAVVRGFWQGAKKLGRAWSWMASSVGMDSSIAPNNIRGQNQEAGAAHGYAGQAGAVIYKEPLRQASTELQSLAASLRDRLGNDGYSQLATVFTERPFIRPMTKRAQLPITIRYIDMNPQRLATKRLKPDYFRVQHDIVVAGRSFDGVGNVRLLENHQFATVHVRRAWVKMAETGNDQPLRDYMNSRIVMARKGVVMVSPFISPHEKQVMQVLLKERHPFICLTGDGFRDYYKPADSLFDACAEGRLMILCPWKYDETRHRIHQEECIALNSIAETLCADLSHQE